MVKLADENGLRYCSGDMYYQRKLGFHDECGNIWEADSYKDFVDDNGRKDLDAFIHEDDWIAADPVELTMEALIDIVGYEFKIV
jgi:hypothetical protein